MDRDDRSQESLAAAGTSAGTLRRRIEPDPEQANEQLVELVADLEDVEQDDLPPLYRCVDDMVAHLYDDPPPVDAGVELTFDDAGYRIELDQAVTW